MAEKPAHLDPSQLGTKEYWDSLYKSELTNHAENPTDEGTVWFDDSDAQTKMVEFLEEQVDCEESLEAEPHLCAFGRISKESAGVIDLGCGNGSMLFALREEGWTGRLLGVDYSDTSVAFANKVQETRRKQKQEDGGEEEWQDVEFQTWDVLNGDFSDLQQQQQQQQQQPGEEEKGSRWDIVLDKGTFDAISLSSERNAQGNPICEGYPSRVLNLLREGGIFLITSCNWTEDELKAWIEGGIQETVVEDASDGGKKEIKKYRMRQIGRVKYPSFSFGGVQGSTISTLCFVKEAVAV
ncbi:S-adenosyl-L-methionine-dependent methyltransferase [Rhypophila decipiens]